VPTSGIPVSLLKGRQWLAVAGSVGQPRDNNPAACFLTYDTQSREVTYCRVAYDVEAAAKRIREAGLPVWLADRLSQGR
jgi:diadenosine tetraphosphatase ApaH/serine/threonine PP2A family protein phosphatase